MEAASCLPGLSAPDSPADPLAELPLRIQGGDLEAFEAMMGHTEDRVLAVAWRMLGDREQARDAAQEVFLRIHRSIGSFRVGEDFRAWVYRITVNVCHDMARHRGPYLGGEALLEQLSQPGAEEAPEVSLLRRERRDLVRRALAALTPSERAALVLRDLEGLETREVSRILGVRPVTVRGQVAAARGKILRFCERFLRNPEGGRP